MEDSIASSNSLFERCGLAQVSSDKFRVKLGDVTGVTAGANQQAQVSALVRECASHVAADKSCGSGDEGEHRIQSITALRPDPVLPMPGRLHLNSQLIVRDADDELRS